MRMATRILAASVAVLMTTASAFSADDPNCAKAGDATDHKETFDFKSGSVYRMIITQPINVQITRAADAVSLANKMRGNNQNPGCSQLMINFNGANTFQIPAGRTEIVKNPGVPDCDWAAAAPAESASHWGSTDGLNGRIEMYCLDKGAGPRHYANMVIWNMAGKPISGAVYAITTKASATPGLAEYVGYGSDGEYAGAQVNLVQVK